MVLLVGWLLVQVARGGLDFPEPRVVARAAADAERVVALFPFKNTGDEAVRIEKHDSGCSCLAVEEVNGKVEFAPGESGVLRATFEIANFRGEVDKPILVWLKGDAEEKPSIVLNVRVVVPVLVEMEPKTLRWKVNELATPQKFHLKVVSEQPLKVVSATGGNGRFAVKLIPIKEGESYDVEVTPLDTAQPGIAVFQIETDSQITRHKSLQGFAVIADNNPVR